MIARYMRPLKSAIQLRFDYWNADYTSINSYLEGIDWSCIDVDDVDNCVSIFYDIIFDAVKFFVPSRRHCENSFPKWVSRKTQNLIYRKKIAHKSYKMSKSPSDYRVFSELRKQVKSSLNCNRSDFISRTEANIINDSQHFWTYIRNIRKDSAIPNSMVYKHSSVVGGNEICSKFAEYFKSNYVSGLYSNVDRNFKEVFISENTLDTLEFSHSDVFEAIIALKPRGISGPDGLPSIFVYNCSYNLVTPLHIIFNKCLSSGRFPAKWKFSNVTPIFKAGPRSDIVNYRPVCISNNFAKLFDYMLARAIRLYTDKVIIPQQHGFCQGRSTETNLFLFTTYIGRCLEDGSEVDCIYTDLKKAFDRVPIDLLLFKLRSYYNIGDPLLSCLKSYLSCRYQQVTVNGHCSQSFPVPSGVGQGSHLGPILFILFINDVYAAIKYSRILLFADDCKIFMRVNSYSDQCCLQSDLSGFNDWCVKNGLELNIDKCKLMKFTRKKHPLSFDYKINNRVLEAVSLFKDLGVFVDTKLTFNVHINSIISRANKLLGFIYRSTKCFSNIRCKIILFVSIVRPIIEYCSVIWSPSYTTHINRIERIQSKFIRALCFKSGIEYSSQYYDLHLSYFGLPRLSKRRNYRDIMFLFKSLNQVINCPEVFNLFQLHTPSVHSLRRIPYLHIDYHRTNYGIHSPIVRLSNLANGMQLDGDAFSQSLNSFRHSLIKDLYK